MKPIETILSILLLLVRKLAGRKRKKKDEGCPYPFPDRHQPPFAVYERNGDRTGGYRGNPVALPGEGTEISPVNVIGCCMMLAGGISKLL